MTSIRTLRYRNDNQNEQRIAHNWCFLETEVPPVIQSGFNVGNSVIKDFAGGADMISANATVLTWNSDLTCNYPAGGTATLLLPITEPVDKSWVVLIVGNHANIGLIDIGAANFGAAQGIIYSKSALNGSYTAGDDTTVDATAVPSALGGVALHGKKGGTLTVDHYVPGAGSTTEIGTGAMTTDGDNTFANNRSLDVSSTDILGLMIVVSDSGISAAQRDNMLMEYTNDLVAGINRTPASLENVAY